MKTLIVVDMQNDFIDGALANPAAQAIVEPMAEFLRNFDGQILFTKDTHECDYLDTQEGKNLPIMHCWHGTPGWEINNTLVKAAGMENKYKKTREHNPCPVTKRSFGDVSELVEFLDIYTDEIYICGTCTDICVISVALNLKARFPEIKMYCIANLCAGLTPEKHAAALEVMRSCQIEVI